MKKKTLLTSFLIIVMCLSITVGGTYAMFATESKVNLAITMGNVEVEAYLEKEPTLSSSYGYNLPETKAVYNETTNKIEVVNMVPGDQIDFSISVINKSSVTAKFQTRVAVLDEDGIFDAINVTAWGETMSGEHVGSWMQFAPSQNAETPIMDVPVTVSLPNSDTYTIGVQGKNLSIVFSVIAVQGNAYTGPTANITKYTQEQLPARNPITGNLGGITFPEAPEEITVESAWSFATLDTEETVQTSQYKDWVCDFIIECDKEVALGELGLWGAYGGMDFAFANPYALSEGQSLFMMTSVGMPVTYEYICSEVKVFDCGVFRGLVAPQMKGKKITVSLCLINPDYAMELINEVANEFPEYNETEILFEVMKKSRWEKAIGKDVLIVNKTEYNFE